MDAVRVERDLPTPVLAFVCAALALAVAPGQMLITGMGLFVATLVVRFLVRRARADADA